MQGYSNSAFLFDDGFVRILPVGSEYPRCEDTEVGPEPALREPLLWQWPKPLEGQGDKEVLSGEPAKVTHSTLPAPPLHDSLKTICPACE